MDSLELKLFCPASKYVSFDSILTSDGITEVNSLDSKETIWQYSFFCMILFGHGENAFSSLLQSIFAARKKKQANSLSKSFVDNSCRLESPPL